MRCSRRVAAGERAPGAWLPAGTAHGCLPSPTPPPPPPALLCDLPVAAPAGCPPPWASPSQRAHPQPSLAPPLPQDAWVRQYQEQVNLPAGRSSLSRRMWSREITDELWL